MMICHKIQALFPILAKRGGTSLRATMCSVSNSDSNVIAKDYGDKGIITLNRPKALNAINLDMVKSILEVLRKWETCKTLVIMKGAGEKSFCAGGDVRAVVEAEIKDENDFFKEEYKMNALIGNYKIPYIAVIDGITMGGGVGLSVHGKYRVATERTLFAMPETAIGLFPDVGGSHFLPKLKGKLGLYLGLTGFRLKGEDVFKAGIATHYCPSKNLPDLEEELLKSKGSSDINRILDKFSSPSNKEFVLSSNMKKINECFESPTVEGIVQNLKKDGSEWAIQTLETLSKMSPTSLKVTHRQLKIGSSLSLAECLKMEYVMAVKHVMDSDFPEGVRALLIDKDKNPKWNPSTLEEVTESRIDYYFSKLPSGKELELETFEKSRL